MGVDVGRAGIVIRSAYDIGTCSLAGARRSAFDKAGVPPEMRVHPHTYAVRLPRIQDARAPAQKELAFPSKESVYVDVREAKNDQRTPFAPPIASIRGFSW